jgi:hypothetical protein
MMNPTELEDKQTDEHCRQGIIDAEGVSGDELPPDAAGYGAYDPCEIIANDLNKRT